MTDKKIEEYVVYEGKKNFVHNGKLDLNYNVSNLADIEGLEKLTGLKELSHYGTGLRRIENLDNLINLEVLIVMNTFVVLKISRI